MEDLEQRTASTVGMNQPEWVINSLPELYTPGGGWRGKGEEEEGGVVQSVRVRSERGGG